MNGLQKTQYICTVGLVLALLVASCADSSQSPVDPFVAEESPPVVFDPAALTMEGLVAFYPFIGDASDHSGWNNHGTVMGAGLAQDRFNREDHAYQFNGVDDFILLSERAINDSLTDFTVSLWYRTGPETKVDTPSLPTGDRTMFFEAESGGAGLWIRMRTNEDTIVVSALDKFSVAAAGAFNDGYWHHLAVTAAEGRTVRIFVDGVLAGQSDSNLEYTVDGPTPELPMIGRTGEVGADEPRHHFDGALDDIAIFQRGLADEEVVLLWEEGPNRKPYAKGGDDQSVLELTVQFDASNSFDPDGEIVAVQWDFDDGTERSTDWAPTHEFPGFGVYTVVLMVTDNEGGSSTDPVEVEVLDPITCGST